MKMHEELPQHVRREREQERLAELAGKGAMWFGAVFAVGAAYLTGLSQGSQMRKNVQPPEVAAIHGKIASANSISKDDRLVFPSIPVQSNLDLKLK